jgi:hypothetical protein
MFLEFIRTIFMMKNILIALMFLLPISSFGEALLGTFDLNLGGGVRLGQGSSADKASLPYIGFKVSHSEFKFAGNNRLSILPVGVNFDTDAVFSVSLSPIMVIVPNKLSVAFDYFLPSQHKSNVGNFGIFIGFPFGAN